MNFKRNVIYFFLHGVIANMKYFYVFVCVLTFSIVYFQMLKSCKKLSMTVRSPTIPSAGGYGGAPWHMMRQTCSWMDRQGRPVSPPSEYTRPGPGTGQVPPQRYGYGRASSKDRSIRRVLQISYIGF